MERNAVMHSAGRRDGLGAWHERSARPVAMALHDATLSGASVAALRAVPALTEAGWRFAFWVPAPGGAFEWLAERGAEVHGQFKPLGPGLGYMREPPGIVRRIALAPGYLRTFRAFLDSAHAELVHANSVFSFVEAGYARRAGFPTLLHLHDAVPPGWKLRAASALARRGVDDAIAASKACASLYSRAGWTPTVVYESASVPAQLADIRERPRPFVVGTIGAISPRKGTDVFVRAAQRLAAADGAFEFWLVGSADDPLERQWAARVLHDAAEAGINHLPRIVVPEVLPRWDAFVLASRGDPCPLVMLEAMALGLPVIGARSGGITEQVTPECGMLVDPDDPAALAEAIRAMAALSAARRESMGRSGRDRVASAFSPQRQAEGIAAAYDRALASRDRGRRP